MQSLASLMSVKPTDIGNMDDFNESDEEEDKKSVTASGKHLPKHCFLFSDLHFELLPLITTLTFLPLFSSHIPVTSSALLFSLFWLLQSFHTLLLAQIALLPLHLTSETPLEPLFQLQVASSCPVFHMLHMFVCFFLSCQREGGVNRNCYWEAHLYNSISHTHAICSAYHIFLIQTLNAIENHVKTD